MIRVQSVCECNILIVSKRRQFPWCTSISDKVKWRRFDRGTQKRIYYFVRTTNFDLLFLAGFFFFFFFCTSHPSSSHLQPLFLVFHDFFALFFFLAQPYFIPFAFHFPPFIEQSSTFNFPIPTAAFVIQCTCIDVSICIYV